MELYISLPSTSVPEIYKKRNSMILPLILEQIEKSSIGDFNYLFDCYNITSIESRTDTYYLAKNAGVPHTKPVALTGQGGTEVAQCLKFLASDNSFKQAICIASQSLDAPDSIDNKNEASYTINAATVMIISSQKINEISDFKVKFVEVIQENDKLQNNMESIKRKINAVCDKFDWIIIQKNLDLSKDVENFLFDIGLIYNRKKYENINFGCADVFISLEDLGKNHSYTIKKNVLLFLIGHYGTKALIILEKVL